ncbi:MAG TPA: hypothetical protein PLE35_11110 [Lentisphaeria bacterium]|nr:hypothetical protein [Lentisphaeria bacterium]
MPSQNELWYAARMTRVVYRPPRLLETFGETVVQYYVLSEVPDVDEKVRMRRGVVRSARPRVITPHYFLHEALDNFGEDARRYFGDVLNRKDSMRIVQYGLRFEKEEHNEELLGGMVDDIAEQVAKDAQDNLRELRGVMVGPDPFWEVSLLVFLNELVNRSGPRNARELAARGLLDLEGGVPWAVRNEIRDDFAAADSRDKAEALGKKLRDYGVFDEYEDRFFDLYQKYC